MTAHSSNDHLYKSPVESIRVSSRVVSESGHTFALWSVCTTQLNSTGNLLAGLQFYSLRETVSSLSILKTTPAVMEMTPAPAPAPAPAPSTSNPQHPNLKEEFKHKSRLQQHAQKLASGLPSYHTVIVDPTHPPKFKSTVYVGGVAYSSPEAFSRRKDAEQHVAKVALERILKKTKEEGCAPIHKDTTFCKSILKEFAEKVNLEKPIYTTSRCDGLLPVFISTVVFYGKTYKGDAGRNKIEAERLAARAVIQSILEIAGTKFGLPLSQIIKSKAKLYDALTKVNNNNMEAPLEAPSQVPLEAPSQVLELEAPSPVLELEAPSPVRKLEAPPPVPKLKKPKLEPESGLIQNVIQLTNQSSCGGHGGQLAPTDTQTATSSSTGKKRPRKKKKKGPKKMFVDGRFVELIEIS